ncbi:hypothetical protein COU54_00785 [Candidatus Pacearchaeota archaeon CG10_big_fil_rev_8_21_14_0_10_31_24]|nr:MAG: hypothetical protein COU54_00785 [Candidatus Pacearchaeota archaeon CG10_big_fil_rev_8_21_14_0_10_31_24]
MVTTIQLDEKTKEMLDKLKVHYRESYNELLRRMILSYSNNSSNDNLIETLEVISDPNTMREIAKGIESYESGKGKSIKQLRKELGV